MFKGLPEGSRIQLEGFLTDHPSLYLDTGNYLFLLLLALKYDMPSLTEDDLIRLWSYLKTWQLLQLGLYANDDYVELAGLSSFDLSKILSDITKRVRKVSSTPVPRLPNVRYGRMLVVESEDGNYEFWMVLQKSFRSSEAITGMWHNVNPVDQSNRFRWSVNRSDVLAASARRAMTPLESDDIAVIDSDGSSYLWILDGDNWNPAGRIEIIRKVGGQRHWIRGVRVLPSTGGDGLECASPISLPDGLSELVSINLDQIQNLSVSCSVVKCSIGIDSENYVLTLHSSETEGETVHGQLIFEITQDLMDFLRAPLTVGEPIEIAENSSQRYTWNPYTDINYGNLGILKPFVERKKPFARVGIALPSTAKELLESKTECVDLVISHNVHQCPIWLGINDDHAACWVLECEDDVPSAISSILKVGLTDIEIGEILKTREIRLNRTQFEIKIDFPSEDKSDRLVFRESRVFARHLCEKKIPASSFLKINEEILVCRIFKESDFIGVSIKSDITGDMVYSGPLVRLFKDIDVNQAMEHVNEVFVRIAKDRFASENSINRIQSYEILLQKVKDLMVEGA